VEQALGATGPATMQPKRIPPPPSMSNTLTACLWIAGLVGNMLVEDMGLGVVAPFDASIAVMVLAGAIILVTWSENYGKTTHRSIGAQFSEALHAICAGVLTLGNARLGKVA